MSDLSPQARSLLSRVSSADGPTSADRKRVLALVGASVAGGAAAATGTATGAAVATGGAAKLVVAFVVSIGIGGGLTTAGVLAVRSSNARPQPQVRTVAPSRAAPPVQFALPAEPEPVAPAGVTPAVAPELPAARARPPTPPPQARLVEAAPERTPEVPSQRPAQARADDPCELSVELGVIEKAQRALAADPSEALAALDGFDQRCPAGALAQERLATRALALCAAGRLDEGRVVARQLAERFPASPSLARVTQSCKQ